MSDGLLLKANEWLVSRLPEKMIEERGAAYLAGSSIEEGLESIQEYYHHKYSPYHALSTVDILSEAAKSKEQADRYFNTYLKIIEELPKRFEFGYHPHACPVSVSVKPSAICWEHGPGDSLYFDPNTPLLPRLEQLVKEARARKVDVTLDMEDHRWTSTSLDTAQQLWKKGYSNLGVAFQSRLHRTKKDLEERIEKTKYPFDKKQLRGRICIGTYRENKDIACSKREAKIRLLERCAELFSAGIYVKLATHDKGVINDFLELTERAQIEGRRYEFQFLKGVPAAEEELIPMLLKIGKKVRLYMPIELSPEEGNPYMIRRMKEDPSLLWCGIKSEWHKIWH